MAYSTGESALKDKLQGTFWTITAVDSACCNDRSQRFNSLNEAVLAATGKVCGGSKPEGMIVMQSVILVVPKPQEQPVIILHYKS